MEGAVWPAVPDDAEALLQSLRYQLKRTQWWTAEQLQEEQDRQLEALLAHASETVPFYRERSRARGPMAPERWGEIPLLSRREVRDRLEDLVTERPLRSHGPLRAVQTAGAEPVTLFDTEVVRMMERAFLQRELLWRRRDPGLPRYAAREVGIIALPCPEHERYHVQAEGVRVEILDEAGAPCAPGRAGDVVVTSLHNFVVPLIRYRLGDRAQAGPPCPCGRGLPTLVRL